jgi:hypothetical protein
MKRFHSLRSSPGLVVALCALVAAIAGTSWLVSNNGAAVASAAGNKGRPKYYSITVSSPVTTTATFKRTIPSGKTFLLSEIILQNPASDIGRIHVRRGKSRLLNVGLQNFDTEQHTLTKPIKFSGGQKLVLFIDCDNASGGCTPAALFVGVLKG